MNARTPKWWMVEGSDQERITAASPTEAIVSWADDFSPRTIPAEGVVIGWAPRIITAGDCGDILESVLESLDEEYGDPEGYSDSSTLDGLKAMAEAEKVFIAAIVANYESWNCDEVCRQPFKTVDHVPADWPVEGRNPAPEAP